MSLVGSVILKEGEIPSYSFCEMRMMRKSLTLDLRNSDLGGERLKCMEIDCEMQK